MQTYFDGYPHFMLTANKPLKIGPCRHVLCTFNLRPVSTGEVMKKSKGHKQRVFLQLIYLPVT